MESEIHVFLLICRPFIKCLPDSQTRIILDPPEEKANIYKTLQKRESFR